MNKYCTIIIIIVFCSVYIVHITQKLTLSSAARNLFHHNYVPLITGKSKSNKEFLKTIFFFFSVE